jgi:hypothetical protein
MVACIAFNVRFPASKLSPFARGSTDTTHRVVLSELKDSVSFNWTKWKNGKAREKDSQKKIILVAWHDGTSKTYRRCSLSPCTVS